MPAPVTGAPQGDAQQAELLQQHLDAVSRMRQGGATWDEVHQYYAQQTGRMRQGGATEAEIQAYYGGQDPAPVADAINSRVTQNVAAAPQKSWVDSFVDGLTNSSSAALLGHAPTPDVQGEGQGNAISHAVGETIGDLPEAIAGAFVGGKATTMAVARVPGLQEFAVPAGGIVGAFNAGAVPTLIKSERDEWIKAGNAGWNAGDFLQQHGLSAQAAVNTAEQGGISALTGGVGSLAEQKIAQAGIKGGVAVVGKLGAEAATYTTASAAIQGRMPTAEDFVDGSILLAAFHVAGKTSAATMRGYRARLQQNYVSTGENPMEAAQRAKADPVFRRELMGDPSPEPLPGSARASVPDHVQRTTSGGAHDTTAPPQDQYVVPRLHGDFDSSVAFTLKHEGEREVIDANGAKVKWGINKADNPGVDVDHLTEAQAAEIYKHKYWDAIDADHLPPAMRAAAFDTAVVEGVSRAKQWLAESGGDPKVLLGKRAAWEAMLASKNPEKFGRFSKAWATRLRDLGGHEASAGLVDRDATAPFTDHENALLENEGLPPESPEPPAPPPPRFGDDGSDDGQHWDRVMDRVAKPAADDWWGNTVQGAQGIYRDLFNRGHAVDRLVGAISQGTDLEDAKNPLFLRRLAENTDEDSKYAIERGMTDLDGNLTGKSLKEIVEQVGDPKEQARFTDGYAMSKWALMMEDQGKKTGVDVEDAKRVVAEGAAKFEKPFQELVGWRNGTLGWLREVHGSDKVDKLLAANEASIPGYRDMGDGKWAPGRPGQNVWNPIKTAMGSERKVQPILHSLMQDAFLRRSLALTNRANVALVDAAMEAGLGGQKRAVDVNVMAALDKLKDEGIDEDVTTSLLRASNSLVPKDEVPIFRDGKLYGAKFADDFKDAVPVLRGYDKPAQGTVMRMIASITSVPRRLQTVFNPAFPVKLLTYDLPWQFITNPDAKAPLVNFVSGLGAMFDKEGGGLYDQWMRSGGAERVFQSMSHDDYLKSVFKGQESEGLAAGAMNLVKSPFHALDAWARMVSTPLRLGRYIEGLKGGESPTRAAVASTEAAFHRPGYGGVFGRAWNSIVPFLTAHLNGMEKSVRAQFGIGETITGVKYDWKATTAKALVTLTVPAMAMWWFNKDQDWYKAMPDWQKDNAWIIVPPIGGAPAIPIAGPPLISSLYIGLPRRLAEAFIQDNPHAADNLAASFGASLMPPGGLSAASILQPVVEHIANFSFFKDQNLVSPDTLKGVGAAEQFNHYSSGVARAVARFTSDIPLLSDMKLSPPVIDNYLHFWAGQPGQLALKAIDAAGNIGKANQPPAMKVSDWPIISSWTTRYPSASAQPIQDFYDRSNQMDQVHGSMKAAMQDGDLARFKQLAERSPSAAAYHMMRFQDEPSSVDTGPYIQALADASAKADWNDLALYKEGQGAMKQAGAYVRKVWESPQLSAQDKRQILDQTYATMQVMAERTNEAMDRSMGRVSSHAPPAPDSIDFVPPDQRVQ